MWKVILGICDLPYFRCHGSIDPAIVTKRNFDTVQRIMQRDIRIAPAEETVYPFSGYLKCADCGQNMVRKHYTAGDKEYTYFICPTRKAKKGCVHTA